MQIQNMVSRDIPAVLKMMEAYYGYDGLAFDARAAGRRLRRLLRTPALGAAWVLVENGARAGYLFVARSFGLEHGSNVLIDELYISEPFRRQGWGTAIVRQVTDYARRLGAESIHAHVERHNRAACRFWQAMEFHRHDRYVMVHMPRGGR
ncbi:MAG: GNAT family N-acetyltransferase [Verrucomicrobia bacterium]|nr:GNAT family N-acetyltransferase [Verrucomicrobiota bacterium]